MAAGTVPDSKVARDAAAAYNSVPDVRSAVQTHAGGLLQLLANRELIETPAVSSLPVTELYSDSMTAYFESEEGVIVFGTVVDGEPRTRIEMKTWTSEGQQLIVVVRPQIDESYAVLTNQDATSGVQILAVSESSDGQLSPQECTCIDSTVYCAWSCIEGRCQCVEFNYGDGCSDDTTGEDCYKCWTEDESYCNCSEERTC